MEKFTRKDCIKASFDYHKILHLLSNQEVEKVICEVDNFLNTSKNYDKDKLLEKLKNKKDVEMIFDNKEILYKK